jgi:hypothetical protein
MSQEKPKDREYESAKRFVKEQYGSLSIPEMIKMIAKLGREAGL